MTLTKVCIPKGTSVVSARFGFEGEKVGAGVEALILEDITSVAKAPCRTWQWY